MHPAGLGLLLQQHRSVIVKAVDKQLAGVKPDKTVGNKLVIELKQSPTSVCFCKVLQVS